MKKITPLLYVDAIEPVLPFWVGRLDFEIVVEVPDGETLGFVLLRRGSAELMYQTRTSMSRDLPALASHPMEGSFLYVEVDDLDRVEERLSGIDPIVPRRATFYGSQEIVVREPAGNPVTLSQFDGQ